MVVCRSVITLRLKNVNKTHLFMFQRNRNIMWVIKCRNNLCRTIRSDLGPTSEALLCGWQIQQGQTLVKLIVFSEGEKILDLNKKKKKNKSGKWFQGMAESKWVIHAQTGYFPYTPASVQSSQTGCCSLISGSPERFSPPLWLLLRKRVSFFPATYFPNVTNRWANVTPEPKPKPGLGRGGLSDVDWWANKWLMNTADGVRGDGSSHRPSAPHNPTTPFTK